MIANSRCPKAGNAPNWPWFTPYWISWNGTHQTRIWSYS